MSVQVRRLLPLLTSLSIAVCLWGATPSVAGPKKFGIGLGIGWPTGVVGKYSLTSNQAVQFGAGVGGHSFFGANVDYIYAPAAIPVADVGAIGVYFGGGLFAGAFTAPTPFVFGGTYLGSIPLVLGAEIPIGGVWNFRHLPFDIFLEVAPGLAVLPGPAFTARATLGFRYYFF